MHAATPATVFSEWGIEVTLEPGWNRKSELRTALSWAIDRGYLGRHEGTQDVLSIPWDHWDSLATGPSSTDPEDQDRWAFEHEALAGLLHLGGERIQLESIGHVGGSHLQVRLVVNDQVLDLKGSSGRSFRGSSGAAVQLSPLAYSVAQHAREFAWSDSHTRAEQLAFIAGMKARQALLQQFPTVQRRVTLSLGEHLASFEIERPAEFAAKWIDEGKSRVSLQLYVKGHDQPLPIDGLDEQGTIVDLPGRKTVLLSPGAKAIATHARAHQRSRKERVGPAALRTPFALLGDDVDTTGIDFSDYAYRNEPSLTEFSHRVLGFEPAKRDIEPATYSSGTPWYEHDDAGNARFLIRAMAPDGATIQVAIESAAEALEVAARADAAAGEPNRAIDVQGTQVLPSAEFSSQLRELVRLATPAADVPTRSEQQAPQANPNRLRPVVEEVSKLAEPARIVAWNVEDAVPWPELEAVLRSGVTLKAHQRTGIAWLWHRYTTGRSGALLADDMGLGKTLQIASFIALAKALPRRKVGPRPTLIVAPVILIANWADELKRFFGGATFPGRVLELRDAALRSRKDEQGALDRESIQNHDIVITSYESLARYAPSLLAINWDLVVLDEAHRIKNRGTGWSIAARGLSGLDDPTRPRKFEFGVCATGTPVENHVMDLWALYDFLSPGSPFGTFDEYCGDYKDRVDAPTALAAHLDIGSLESSLLRRTKQEVLPLELPGKHYRSIPVEMTDFQRAQELVLTKRAEGKKKSFFGVLQSLQKLYQHPWLLDDATRREQGDADQAIAVSPKLAETLQLLSRIRELGEKALVFTLWTDMQYLLKDVIETKLGVSDVRIINGDPKNRARALQYIDAFTASPGFDVMVLSPLAAGVGLNIVAANHVIHYGRWWNPAKEDQATDRAYRIGQTRPVTVYYPVLHHPGRPDLGFDVKLDGLVTRKRDMARALLDPVDGDDVTEAEIGALGGEER